MSSQKGNVSKKKPPKHANKIGFRNDLHDTNKRTKAVRELEIVGCCDSCRKVIEWKIHYKKYKPLTQPKKCVKCQQKSVLSAYNIICQGCAESAKVCRKCGKDLNSANDKPSDPIHPVEVADSSAANVSTDVDEKNNCNVESKIVRTGLESLCVDSNNDEPSDSNSDHDDDEGDDDVGNNSDDCSDDDA